MVAESVLLPAYAELFCRSNFSFLHGASHAEELVERAVKLGYRGIAITDECSLAGAPRMHVAAQAAGLPLIIGSYFEVTPDEAPPGHDPGPGAFGLVLLAQNREGYGNLSELISWRRMAAPKGTYQLTPRMLSRPPEEFAHLRGMPDCFAILVPGYPVRADVLDAQVAWFRATFGERARLGLVQLQRALDGPQRDEIRAAGARRGVRVVALGDVTMHRRSCKPLQDVMTAIRVGMPVSECGYALAPNAEQHLRSRARIAKLFSADEIAQTCAILDACHFSLKELEYEYPLELVPRGHTPTSYLRQETWAGVARRYWNGVPEKVAKQIRHELALIAKLNYEPFFLTVYDIVKFARSQNILCQGRGSAANSVVCYCLGITEVDPDQSTTLFERFISEERGEPPDIDVDFEHQRREEVIQHIYKKYGKDRAALAAAVSTYRPRGVLREVGKALGVDPMLVDRVAKGHRWFDGSRDLLQKFAAVGLDPATPLIHAWADLAARLLNFPRHLSQHSGGFVISRGKLTRLVPVENAAMDGRRVIQWDKDDLESLKLMKVDVLALGMLSALHRAFDMRTAWRGPAADGKPFTLKHIPQEDKATYDMICRADTVGVFQIESRAQMSMLPRLQPRTYYDLVIEVAIVRPGPIQGGAVHPYLRRRQGLEKISYPKDDLKPALERTRGVPIFQEQVMQIAMIAAGFTAGEADGLRRAMAAWKRKGNLEKYHAKIVDGMRERGYPPDFAEQIFEQIKGFGDYGFPESHAASFAKLAYASSWLKCHEPAIFLAALLNSQPMGFYPPSQLVQDAKRHRVQVLPIDVTHSNWEASLEALPNQPPPHGQPAVRLGMSLVRGLGEAAARRIEAARAAGPFDDVDALARRAQLERRDLEALAAANALATLAGHRRDALWQAVAAAPDRDLLAAAPIDEAQRPALGAPSEADEILADYDTTGLTLNRHPVALLRPALRAQRLSSAAELRDRPDGRLARACGIVISRQMPGTSNGVMFMTLEDETGCVNVIVRPELLARQRRATLDSQLLAASGVWQVVSDVRHLVAQHFEDLTPLLGGLRTSSREFH
ncbi:error-prone DNA polymerase [Burkholderia pseudomultivorans]|uniref:error-prone DNA polymerase n=1 Tax=Burkholderia pseudomultivorans TaxID=1207504 RepID=UPI0007536144|nr:error-prone DNA polymerase [Burkholderia pseudomultivorans]KVC38861.1 DNA polymerase [Burkholderia pseudomultivorans]KVC41343.1 DNA polymerase [Burkholderia pseudomultivorans]